MAAPASPEIITFGDFEARLRSRELCRKGVRVRLPDQSFQILVMLLERRRELVTREEIRQRLWPSDTFVDFDHGLNNAVNRLREALGDSADSPRFVETLPRRGYRFVATVVQSPSPSTPAPPSASTPVVASEKRLLRKWVPVASASLLLLAVLTLAAMYFRRQAVAPPISSLAVLPLENVSGDPGQEYFADGMTDSLITNLAGLKSVRVISRTSAMHCKGSRKTLAEIARELNVDAVVEGTVMRFGDRVRINVQLIDARTDRHLWAKAYDRDLRDVLALQAELTNTIASQVATRVDAQSRRIPPKPVNPEAYDAYLRGRQEWVHGAFTPDGYQKSRAHFNHAIQLDPEYTDAIVGLAATYVTQDAAAARALALRALELNNNLGVAHAILASMKCANEWDFVGAESEFKRAIELEPNSVTTHSWYGLFLAEIGRSEAGLGELKIAESLDPLSLDEQADMGLVLYLARRYDEAEQVLQRILRQDPKMIIAHRHLVRIYAARERIPEYLTEIGKANGWYKATPEDIETLTQQLRNVYAAGGAQAFWRAYIERELQKPTFPKPLGLARLYAHLGDRDQCITILEQLYQERDTLLAVWVKSDPEFDSVRSDPRFQTLLKKIGFPES